MLPWQQKKFLIRQGHERKQLLQLACIALLLHGTIIILISCLSKNSESLLITVGTKPNGNFVAEFRNTISANNDSNLVKTETSGFLQALGQTRVSKVHSANEKSKINITSKKDVSIVEKTTLPQATKLPQASKLKKEPKPAKILNNKVIAKQADKQLSISTTSEKKSEMIEKKKNELVTPVVQPATIPSVPVDPEEKVKLKEQVPSIVEKQELYIGTIVPGESGINNVSGHKLEAHEIADIIQENWYQIRGMPADFSCELEFEINSQGRAYNINIINCGKSLLYQAHVKHSISRCVFLQKYSGKKCKVILKS